MSDTDTSPCISFFFSTTIKRFVSWTVKNRWLKPLWDKMLDWLNFRLGEIIGLMHALEKRYYQNKTQLRYNFGSVYLVLILQTLLYAFLFCRVYFPYQCFYYLDRVKRIWYLSPMRAAKVQASLRIRAVSPEPSLLAHTSSESRGTFRQKARSLAPLNGWACAVKICHDGMLEDTNSLDGAHIVREHYEDEIQQNWQKDMCVIMIEDSDQPVHPHSSKAALVCL